MEKKINLNSLHNKKSVNRKIVYFEYEMMNGEEEVVFRYYNINEVTWRVELVVQPHEKMPYRLFSEMFELPNSSVPLTVVCGLGLLTIKEVINVEMQYYSSLQFSIIDEVSKMN